MQPISRSVPQTLLRMRGLFFTIATFALQFALSRCSTGIYCIRKPHRSKPVKSTTTAISATFAIVFIVSFPYHAPTAPHGGAAGLLGFHWGESLGSVGTEPRDGEG